MPVLAAFLEEMPRIQARESLQRYNAIVLGSGHVKPAATRSAVRRWERLGRGHTALRRPVDRTEHVTQLAAMGIRVIPPAPPKAES